MFDSKSQDDHKLDEHFLICWAHDHLRKRKSSYYWCIIQFSLIYRRLHPIGHRKSLSNRLISTRCFENSAALELSSLQPRIYTESG